METSGSGIPDSPSSNLFRSWDPRSLSPAHFPHREAGKFGALVKLRVATPRPLHPSSQHCERHIQNLQTRVLELQQQLAVAVTADRKKDIMIEQLDKVPGERNVGGTCTPMFTAALLIIANIWKQCKCPSTDEWIMKLWCVCIHTKEHYLTINKKRIKFCLKQQHGWT